MVNLFYLTEKWIYRLLRDIVHLKRMIVRIKYANRARIAITDKKTTLKLPKVIGFRCLMEGYDRNIDTIKKGSKVQSEVLHSYCV